MDSDQINWKALINYLAGQCSPEEEGMIQEWIGTNSKNEEFIIFLKKIWESPTEKKHIWDVDTAWDRFNRDYNLSITDGSDPASDLKQIKDVYSNKSLDDKCINISNLVSSDVLSISEPARLETQTQKLFYIKPQKRYPAWRTWVGVAACIMLVVSGIYFFEGFPGSSGEQSTNYKEIVTENGQRTRVNLSDGSIVILNAGSKLTLPETFLGQSFREVELTGEAFFEVIYHPDQPFIVYTDQAQTEVLGTKFQVRSYPGDQRTEVVVTEGRVSLYKPNQTDQEKIFISVNQLGIWSLDGSDLFDLEDPALHVGWKDGRLIFQDESLARVAKKVQRWYDVDVNIEVSDPALLNHELTAEFSETQPIQEVFEAIALSLDLQYRSDGRNYTFYQ